MKFFALIVLVAVGVSGFSSNRNACPWNNLEDFAADFESATGIQLSELDQGGDCMTTGAGCPSMEEVLNFVQEEFGVDPSETFNLIEMCGADFLGQLGFNGIGV